jgi:Fe2+ or Zn2+ uptake regulation protein
MDAVKKVVVEALYDSTYDYHRNEHCHFTCESCKRVYDAQVDFSDLSHLVTKAYGFDIEDVNVINLSFSGLCWQCK